MAPAILRQRGFRYFFVSADLNEKPHVHVSKRRRGGGEAKFWLKPEVKLEWAEGLKEKEVRDARRFIEKEYETIMAGWRRHEAARRTKG